MEPIIQLGNKKVYPIIYKPTPNSRDSINCFLLEDAYSLTLIDAGIEQPHYKHFFREQLAAYGFQMHDISQILLTHHHNDHTGMVNDIVACKNIPVYASDKAIPRLRFDTNFLHYKIIFFEQLYEAYNVLHRAVATKRIAKLNSTYQQHEQLKIQADILPLQQSQKLGDLCIHYFPGHSPDSIAFYDEATKWLFAGDVIFANSIPNALVDFDEQGELLPTVRQQQQSFHALQSFELSHVFAGHQPSFTNTKEVIEQSLKRMELKWPRIERVLQQGELTGQQLAQAVYGAKLDQAFIFVMSDIIGYTHYGEMQNKITINKENPVWLFNNKGR
ncbi:MBL fold metallo-hydrolase [Metasolibacillus meyeri]|uniref:MBL fold metallo-hydrolase n=1 Tax=Metasolibacillus meyeri TaxID=1071052 RepID=A0AAW9NQ07_9BACL|nr:MBL fold metallo-hydrolase [Metasolibacillus meyeri]MEC1178377.1 MBL fold metallo-hydrolase [Metasolibacillus meyeri]